MALRDDGKETRGRLLEAACEIFAEKGYEETTIAAICKKAGTNVALVNYYFGDKTRLYMEAWQYAFEKKCFNHAIEPDAKLSCEEQLYAYILAMMQNFLDEGESGQFTRLYMMELANPTGLVQDLWHGMIEPKRRVLLGIICSILGKNEVDETVLFCELSIINQCRSLLTIRKNDLEYLLDQPMSGKLVSRLAGHIARFSMAGIKAVSNNFLD